ncbi:hypothetical protein BJF90_33380 [Pseudonocardia sp. CNS-004]|nr:hypothetical protein BJF90_33380 [Pseudonocardia sp. CNS-004]
MLIARLGIVVVALVGWELASGTLIRPFYVSSPSDVAETLFEWIVTGELVYHGGFTVTAALLGYVLGAVAAVLVAWPLAMLRTAYRITEPYFLVAYSIPAVAMGPVFILWFGIGMTPKVLIAAYFVFFIVFINTVAGFQQVPAGLLDVTRVMGASRRDQLRTVLLPSALPFVLAALRITLPAAMIGAVTGEFISANRGLGYLTRAAAASYSTAGVLAGVLCLSAIVLLMNLLLRPLRHALRWQPDVDVGQGAEGR